MATKTKTIDCIALKRATQEALRSEYERRCNEFDSYSAFLEAALAEHDWSRRFVERYKSFQHEV